ncbi:hypothetical protein BM1_01854 [Bipolaris maydis]|nr:hypothetical protein BM1_01854 [Bipolaris maydis]
MDGFTCERRAQRSSSTAKECQYCRPRDFGQDIPHPTANPRLATTAAGVAADTSTAVTATATVCERKVRIEAQQHSPSGGTRSPVSSAHARGLLQALQELKGRLRDSAPGAPMAVSVSHRRRPAPGQQDEDEDEDEDEEDEEQFSAARVSVSHQAGAQGSPSSHATAQSAVMDEGGGQRNEGPHARTRTRTRTHAFAAATAALCADAPRVE